MHPACISNSNGTRLAPDKCAPDDRLGAAFTEPAASPEGGGRDARGRFTAGNAGGPGNPFARRTAELRREFMAEATGEDLRAVCRALLERAKEGDVAAAKLALGYLVGKPEKAVDPDTLDEQEWQLWRRYTAPGDWVELIQTLPLDLVLRFVREVWPVLAREKCAQAEPLFATPTPAPQEPELEAGEDKPRARRRGGKGRRSRAEEGSPETKSPAADLSIKEPGLEEVKLQDCPVAVGKVAIDRDDPPGARETAAAEPVADDRQAEGPSDGWGKTVDAALEPGTPADADVGGEGRGPEGQTGVRPRVDGLGEPSRRPAAGQAHSVAPQRVPGSTSGSGPGGPRCPSANGDNGAAPTTGAAVNKPDNRQERVGQGTTAARSSTASDQLHGPIVPPL